MSMTPWSMVDVGIDPGRLTAARTAYFRRAGGSA